MEEHAREGNATRTIEMENNTRQSDRRGPGGGGGKNDRERLRERKTERD